MSIQTPLLLLRPCKVVLLEPRLFGEIVLAAPKQFPLKGRVQIDILGPLARKQHTVGTQLFLTNDCIRCAVESPSLLFPQGEQIAVAELCQQEIVLEWGEKVAVLLKALAV